MPKMTKHIKPMAALMPMEIPNDEPEAAIGRYQQADFTAPISTACTSTSTLQSRSTICVAKLLGTTDRVAAALTLSLLTRSLGEVRGSEAPTVGVCAYSCARPSQPRLQAMIASESLTTMG